LDRHLAPEVAAEAPDGPDAEGDPEPQHGEPERIRGPRVRADPERGEVAGQPGAADQSGEQGQYQDLLRAPVLRRRRRSPCAAAPAGGDELGRDADGEGRPERVAGGVVIDDQHVTTIRPGPTTNVLL